MLKLIRFMHVIDDEKHFEVKHTGRFESKYIEGGKKITVHVEPGIDGDVPCQIVERFNFNQWDDGQDIPESKRDEIIQNYVAATGFEQVGVILR